jgi:hypothetical protein
MVTTGAVGHRRRPCTPFLFAFMQHLAQDTVDMFGLQEEVIRSQEAATAAEATCAEVVRAAAASAQEAVVTWERVATLI